MVNKAIYLVVAPLHDNLEECGGEGGVTNIRLGWVGLGWVGLGSELVNFVLFFISF